MDVRIVTEKKSSFKAVVVFCFNMQISRSIESIREIAAGNIAEEQKIATRKNSFSHGRIKEKEPKCTHHK